MIILKKRKTYEISVIDKTYSKIISDETKFYTSDTALELAFELKETEYNFESAEIVLLNVDDRSLATRPVSKINNDFVYEIDDDITSHYGDWRGQLMLVEKGEVHVSSPIKFRIENDLYCNKPLEITEVVSWVSLKRYADGLIDELKQAVLSAEGLEDTFNANETERQTTFETNESERDKTFNDNETVRQTQELEREGAESKRQTVFDDNEANRTETFNANEATRQENEDARIEAEKQREGTVTKIENRQTSVETQFNSVQQELTDKDIVSAPEIIAARNGEADLKTRLDKEQQEVDAQLAQKVGNGKKAELEDLSATVLSAIEGGEDTSFNLLSIPQDKSVSVGKTDFINESVNKLNLHDKDFIEGKIITKPNAFVELDGYFTSGFIPVKNGDVVRYAYNYGMGANNVLYLYDIDQKAIGVTSPVEYPYEYNYREETIDLEGVYYLRLSYANRIKASAMVTINMPYPDNFVPYQNQLDESFVFNETQKNFILDNMPELNIKSPLANKVVSFNGDSISSNNGGYGKIIAEQNNMIYENVSVSGGTLTAEQYSSAGNARHWISRTIDEMREDADYVILEGGVNDGALGVPKGEITNGYIDILDDTTYCGALESICKQAWQRFPNAKIGFVIVHKMTISQADYRDETISILEKWGINYIDLYTKTPPLGYIPHLKDEYTTNGDGWHPTEEGYVNYYVDPIGSWMKTL